MVLLPMCPHWKTLGLMEVQGERKGTVTRGEMHGGSDLLEEKQVGTASFLAVKQVKGGNRMVEVRGPLFHCRGEPLRTWEILEASIPGVPMPGCEEHQSPTVIS